MYINFLVNKFSFLALFVIHKLCGMNTDAGQETDPHFCYRKPI